MSGARFNTQKIAELATIENARAWEAEVDKYLFADDLLASADVGDPVTGSVAWWHIDMLEGKFMDLLDGHKYTK